MKKFLLNLIITALVFSATACAGLIPSTQSKEVTVTFTQEGQAPISITAQTGKALSDIPTPVQSSDTTLITEWNLQEDFIPTEDMTVQAVSYTKGLEFDYTSYFTSERYASVKKYTGTATKIVVPQYFRGYPVGRIGKEVFRSNKSITSVSLPEGLLEIQFYAFSGCANITEMNLPSTLMILGENSISDADIAGKLVFPAVAEISERVLFGSTITELVLPEGVYSIGAYTFGGKSALKSVVLPKSVSKISGVAFWAQPLESVFFAGDEIDWLSVEIDEETYREFNFGTKLENEEIKLYYYSETEPTKEGNYWHYINGNVAIWS